MVGIMSTPKSNWRAAVELGLVSSTFSTFVSHLFAARTGRDAAVDWMTVAAIHSPRLGHQRRAFLELDFHRYLVPSMGHFSPQVPQSFNSQLLF